MSRYVPTAAEVAQFDQVQAVLGGYLEMLAEIHRGELVDTSQAVAVACTADFIRRVTTSHQDCADLLAVAIDRMSQEETRV